MPVVAGSALAGTAVEWYDFFLYGAVAALVFPSVFFPSSDPITGVLLSFSTYAVGFIARPVGAAVLGNLGDRKGRKVTLIWTLMIMGGATFCIGLLPSHAAIGSAAPILLLILRLVQGFALGGEWGGAVLFASEHSSSTRRAFWTAWPSMGPPLGNLIASGVLSILSATMPEEAFLSWGWRIAFFLSALLVLIGVLLRRWVAETPLFEEQAATSAEPTRQPALEAVRSHWRMITLAALARFGDNASFYIFSVFVITYTSKLHDRPSGPTLNAVTIGMAVCTVSIPIIAIAADRVGRRPIMLAACVATTVWPFVFFPLVDTVSFGWVLLAISVGLLLHGMFNAVLGPIYAELFPTAVRYSAVSIAYNVASVFAGSLAPIIALALYSKFDSPLPIAIYIGAMSLLSLFSALAIRESKGTDLSAVGEQLAR